MAIDFDGVNDTMQFSNTGITAPGSHSFACWVFRESGGDTFGRLFQNGDVNSSITLMNTATDELTYRLTETATSNDLVTTTSPVTITTWVHIGFTFDGTNQRIYVDGTEDTATTVGIVIDTATGSLGAIGGDGTSNSYYSGRIAEPAYWDVDLDATEMAAMARGINPNRIRHDNLQRHWPLYGNASPEINFTSADSNATISGAVKSPHAQVELLENYL